MNMNDKEWNELWDNEPDEDEDEYNDIGSDIDANNDETFDNAAEWNEDEHEELIARDSILSHTIPRNNNNNNNNNNGNIIMSNNNNIHNNSNNNVFRESNTPTTTSTRQVLRVDELEQQLLKTRISQNNSINQPSIESIKHTPTVLNEAHKRAGWSPFAGKDLFTASSPTTQAHLGAFNQNLLLGGQLPQNLTLEQQQQLVLQHHLIQQQQQQLQQMAFLKQQQIEQEQKHMSQNPQCFTVEELERQMFANRSSNKSQVDNNASHSVNMITVQESTSKLLKSKHQNHELQYINQNNGNRRNEIRDPYERLDNVLKESRDQRDHRGTHRETREPKEVRDTREHRENREHRNNRDYRDHQRDNQRNHRDNQHHHHHHNRQHNRRTITIIPPQVQLKVIDKAKRLHSITAMHSDEFLQDRLPTSEDGFMFKRHSTVTDEKANHDGILTEKERNWLTKIQEKIQADYDDHIDQDYYYLLYFNRSSMTNEAAQKPCGPGVLDRRFIPRERLLYNTST